MPDTAIDIIDLLHDIDPQRITYIAQSDRRRYHAAIQALVAERDELKQLHAHLGQSYTMLSKECDALKRRVAELESHPPAASDLRERLVCAALTGVCADPNMNDPDIARFAGDIADAAVAIANATLAAMRKEATDGK